MNKSLTKWSKNVCMVFFFFNFIFLSKEIYAEEFDEMCGMQSVQQSPTTSAAVPTHTRGY